MKDKLLHRHSAADGFQLLGEGGGDEVAGGTAESQSPIGTGLGLGESAAEPQLFLVEEKLLLGFFNDIANTLT